MSTKPAGSVGDLRTAIAAALAQADVDYRALINDYEGDPPVGIFEFAADYVSAIPAWRQAWERSQAIDAMIIEATSNDVLHVVDAHGWYDFRATRACVLLAWLQGVSPGASKEPT